MDSFSWPGLLKLEQNHCILHHTGHFATVARVSPCRYEDGEIELRFDSGPLKLLYLNYRAQLEHHVFYAWHPSWPAPAFRAGDRVWRRGDAIGQINEIEAISPRLSPNNTSAASSFYRYYLKGSQELHPETYLVRSSLTA